jgi:Tol biopolymer transport system component
MLLLLGGVAVAGSSGGPKTQLVNVSLSGGQTKGQSNGPLLSADGRLALFDSSAPNLIRGDTNHASDVFVRDLKTRKTWRVSVNSKGQQANGAGYLGSISSGGRYVTFSSYASNLARRDRNGRGPDVYLRDRKLHKTIRINVSSSGKQGGAFLYQTAPVSADGHLVAFNSWGHLAPEDTNGWPDVFVRNRKTHKTELVSVGLGGMPGERHSWGASMSADGRFVAFGSYANNLVPHDRNGHGWDVFVRDLKTHTTAIASVDSSGQQNGQERKGETTGGTISADGRFVVFTSYARLVDDDTNGGADAYLRDLKNGTTERVSLGPAGNQALYAGSYAGEVSAHGEFVTFQANGEEIMPSDTNGAYYDGFVRDVAHRTTTRVSVNTAGEEANGDVGLRTISADGRFVGFWSNATNLLPRDTNGTRIDIFVRGPLHP